MSCACSRRRAQLIYRSFAHTGILAPERYSGDLVDWILEVQGRHLEPLRTKSTYVDAYGDKVTTKTSTDIFGDRKTTRTVRDIFGDKYKTTTFDAPSDVVVFGGAQLPVLVESHLRALDRARLREHAQLIYRSFAHTGILAPERYSGDLVDWILEVQGRHLEPLRTKSTYLDAYGDKVTTSTSTDIFGDRKTTRTIRDAFGDTTKTSTLTDPYGDKITTRTSTDIFGDRKTTRTFRNAFGD